MAALQQVQRQYDGQCDEAGDRWDRYSEAVSERVSQLEKCPDAVEMAINRVDCDHTEELMALRVKAFMSGRREDCEALQAREDELINTALRYFAKRDVGDEVGPRIINTAESLADLIRRRMGAQS